MANAPADGGTDDFATRKMTFASDALTGRTALVSGGSGGIGRATAWLLARMGAAVIVTGRDEAKLAAIEGELSAAGHTCAAYALNIRDPEIVAETLGRIWREQGPIDALINSAGGQFPLAAIDYTVKGWNTVVDSNLNGTWHMMQTAAQLWREAERGGSITNVVVVTARGLYGVAHTIAARSGVIGLSRALSVEWAPLGIRINCVAPGAIETEGWRVYSEEARNSYSRSNPMMRPGEAWDIAEACAYLAAPSGKYVTGELLTVDGGAQHWGETWTIPKPDYFKIGG